jgi:hypothetical protein
MRLRVRPLALELLERDDDLDRLLDGVDAAASVSACVDGEVAGRRVRLHTLDLDAEMHEATLRGTQPELGRLDGQRHVAGISALDDLAGAVPDHLLVAHEMEDDVAPGPEPLLEGDLRRPQGCRDAPFHIRRTAPVETAAAERAAERILGPRARVADRHDVQVTVERERAAASRACEPRDDQRMGGEGGRRADVPALDLEAERGEEVADVADAAAGLVREVSGFLRLALGPEADQVTEEAVQLRLRGLDRPDGCRARIHR